MFTTIKDIFSAFVSEFTDTPIVVDSKTIPVIYGRKSKNDLTEVTKKSYPLISILDYTPKISEIYGKNYQQSLDDFTQLVAGKYEKGKLFDEPRLFEYKIDVTLFTKDPYFKLSVNDYFFAKYEEIGNFEFNKVEIDDVFVADIVPYKIEVTEIERSDGVFEVNYEFTLTPMVAIKDGEEKDLVTQVNLDINS